MNFFRLFYICKNEESSRDNCSLIHTRKHISFSGLKCLELWNVCWFSLRGNLMPTKVQLWNKNGLRTQD